MVLSELARGRRSGPARGGAPGHSPRRERFNATIGRLWILLILSGAIATGSPAAAAHAQETGTLTGAVVNATAGSGLPTGFQLMLESFRTTERLPVVSAAVEADGSFKFEGLATGTAYAYRVSATYQGVHYASDLIQFGNDHAAETGLTVYEATHEDPGISRLSLTRLLRHGTADALTVVEIVDFMVPGDRAYVPIPRTDGPPPIRFAVPDGAFGLQPLAGFGRDDLVIGGPGFAVFTPLPPGPATLAYAYRLALEGGEVRMAWRVDQPARTVRLLSEPADLEVSVQGLPYVGEDAFAGLSVRRWEAQEPPRGAVFDISVRDLTVSGFVRAIRSTTADRWAAVAAAAAGLGALGLAFWRRRWRRDRPEDGVTEARQLAGSIAAIDAALAGAPHDQALVKRRQELKSNLRSELRRRPGLAGAISREIASRTPPPAARGEGG